MVDVSIASPQEIQKSLLHDLAADIINSKVNAHVGHASPLCYRLSLQNYLGLDSRLLCQVVAGSDKGRSLAETKHALDLSAQADSLFRRVDHMFL